MPARRSPDRARCGTGIRLDEQALRAPARCPCRSSRPSPAGRSRGASGRRRRSPAGGRRGGRAGRESSRARLFVGAPGRPADEDLRGGSASPGRRAARPAICRLATPIISANPSARAGGTQDEIRHRSRAGTTPPGATTRFRNETPTGGEPALIGTSKFQPGFRIGSLLVAPVHRPVRPGRHRCNILTRTPSTRRSSCCGSARPRML